MKEQKMLKVVTEIEAKQMTGREAAKALRLSLIHERRIVAAYGNGNEISISTEAHRRGFEASSQNPVLGECVGAGWMANQPCLCPSPHLGLTGRAKSTVRYREVRLAR